MVNRLQNVNSLQEAGSVSPVAAVRRLDRVRQARRFWQEGGSASYGRTPSLAAQLAGLPIALRQALSRQQNAAINELLRSWGKFIREMAELDKKSAARAALAARDRQRGDASWRQASDAAARLQQQGADRQRQLLAQGERLLLAAARQRDLWTGVSQPQRAALAVAAPQRSRPHAALLQQPQARSVCLRRLSLN